MGPGVRRMGEVDSVWTDHTDVRPTMLALLGLVDDYVHDGRVVVEPLYAWAVPQSLLAHRETWLRLARAYKQLNGTYGSFSMAALAVSTRALASGSAADDGTYTFLEGQIASWTLERNTLATAIKAQLEESAFYGQALDEQLAKSLTDQANQLIDKAVAGAAG